MRYLLLVSCLGSILCAQSADVDVGKANFRLFCAPCHGIHAQGGRGPDLTQTTSDVIQVISHGVPGTEMAGYSGDFDAAMIERLAAYIRSAARVNPVKVSGDAEHGHALFAGTANCSGCHGNSGIGPALDRVGRQRSLEYLREKLLRPGTSITPGYSTVTVTLKDGRTIRGIRKGIDDFSVQLVGTDRQFHSFRTEETVSIEQDSHSLMPDQKLSDTELTDLLAYLVTLRGNSN